MTIELTKQQIALLLETLQEQYLLIKNGEGKIPQIELDILLNNTRKFYEALLQLNKINSSATEIENIAEEKKIEEVKADMQMGASEKIEIIADLTSAQEEQKTAPEIIQEIKTEEAPEKITAPVDQKIMDERTNAINKTSKTVSKSGSLFEEEPVVANKFESQQTIHDKIAKSKEEKSWHEKLQSQPVTDLKKSIGINEKFKFVNELFDGHLQDYNESIDFLNNCKTVNEAQNFIDDTLIPKFNWKKDSAVYQSLQSLIERKFNS
jgi:hypothetical protein